jgi:predicted RNase H-like nuclease (RuvC/YqgF family)
VATTTLDPLAAAKADLAQVSARASDLSAEVERWKRETKKGQRAIAREKELDDRVAELEAAVKAGDARASQLEARLRSAEQARDQYEGESRKLSAIKNALA